ncbi:uncharacterized protein LOC103313046 isoform X2 [Tribolium castaneum]|uniref:uncharacterized protein LOC103315196 isoform X2 n=1 Tax=Tribolium castaneum TaxID=7070 RepID=UPI00077DC194|nr:PREDICTED: uncharacterized protein LOC103315196 isoform X2 [Tribolium castaneum]|eukprot:XP_015840661.1 PREDICTED: uncharacterized protein LOC103315196 isoform X2 [Tribolium castaneum]
MFIKIKHIHLTKLAKIDISSATYEDLVNIAKLKFPELADEQIYFHEKDGTILEEDVILDFLKENSRESILLIVCKIRATADELNFASASTVSIISTEYQDTDESTTSEDEISENISVVPSDKRIDPNIQKEETFKKPMGYKEMSVEGWKKFIRNRMGDEIFEFYSRNGFLKKSLRIQLVNATTSELVRMYGISVPEFAKRNLGQAIISIFPKLRNPCGPTGYEAFYKNDNGGEGFISYRLRFIAKNSKDEDIRAAVRRRKRKAVENASDEVKEKKEDCRNTYKNVITITPEISDCVEFLRNASPQTDQEAILDRMKKTFTYRRSLDVNVLSIFPRFLDTPYLIEHDFRLLFPDKELSFIAKINNDAEKILSIYDSEVATPATEILGSTEGSSDKFDKVTRSLLALAKLLQWRVNSKQLNQPVAEILSSLQRKQPFLLAQGHSNKGAITKYHIVVDRQLIPCPDHCSSAEAFQLLFMTHYVFNIRYDHKLKFFWEFIQTYYFDIESEGILYTPLMCLVRTRLLND